MRRFERYRRGAYPAGTVVVRLVQEGGAVKGYVREIPDVEDEADSATYPSELLDPEMAFRLAENKRRDSKNPALIVELEPGMQWNPAWGTLSGT